MEEIKLDVHIRNQMGSRKIRSIRREDFVPGIIYGGKEGPMPIKIDRRAYERIMRFQKRRSVVFHLHVMDGDKKLKDYSTIIKEEQHEPVFDKLLHIDFHRISLTEEIEVKAPIIIKGEAVGVKEQGGSLDQPLWELNVICLPTNIPEKIEVKVDELKIGDAIHVKDLVLPEGVKTKHDGEAIVVSVVPPMKEEPTEVVKEEVLTEPEVIKEKKEKKVKEEAEASEETKPKGKEEKAEKKTEKAEGK